VPEHSVFVSYFETDAVICAGCGEPFDLWAQACDILKTWPRDWVAFRLLGAIVTRKSVLLEPERNTEVDLNEVPEDAEILSVRAMVMGPPEGQPVFPALKLFQGEMRLDPFPRHFLFYGMTHGRADVAATSVWLSVTWIQPDEDEISVHHLADAAKQFAAGRHKGMIIPANVAVEAALTPAVTAWVRTYCSGEETKEFLGPRGATYAHQLKVLSRIASHTLGIKPMPDRLRALLNQLRQYRNDLGHNGTLNNPDRPPPNLEKAADFLTAAIFGYQYARYLHSRVAGLVPAATTAG
jgi:hypothetical protein